MSALQLEPPIVHEIIRVADLFGDLAAKRGRMDVLSDKTVALLFLEPSSRTMLSFQSAAQKLRAGVIFAQGLSSTSASKGERIEDMIRVVSSYADIVIMRHGSSGSAAIAAEASSVPFINAGDGSNEHPTQALIDAYTIIKEVGRLDNLRITFGFDPRQSRSIHSLALLLSAFPGNAFTFVSPEELQPTKEFLSSLEQRGATCKVTNTIDDCLDVDVLYVNRLQEERFPDREVFERHRRRYVLTPDLVRGRRFSVLDPLPRVDEIVPEVDALPNAAYFRQARNGVPIRMALLAMVFDRPAG